MNRRSFLQQTGLGILAMSTVKDFKDIFAASKDSDSIMPVLFVGHGSPMNAIEDNEFSTGWMNVGKSLPKPKAILCVSAHWQTRGTMVTAMEKPQTIHDFGGFPKALFDKQYPAPGSPEFAKETKELIKKTSVSLDEDWGLDHGTWSVLARMFPNADIPTYQLSLDYTQPPEYHYELAKELQELRKKGILIIGSGNIVHNLRMVRLEMPDGFDWAVEFDDKIRKALEERDHKSIIHYEDYGSIAKLSIPTNEHYLPLLYAIALQQKNENLAFFNAKNLGGSISMRSLIIH
ncbi:MAG: 4,5-DOPA dioxygenase extradiol [Bacteroidota bacterium]|nr:4,5-DOPA dioxygenase extradiol [Bacteroidota bacterium]MDP4229892.1 4,5-DOPA dioxygenase extradiol [Bacteroidota bacterium]MDP4236857.1 4,5-DOPA dioxygenase extradiol [Bacteroidota bacterium]